MKNHWFSLLFGALAALEASWSRLGGVWELSWSRLGAAAAFDAAFDAATAASKLLRSCFELLRSALGSSWSRFGATSKKKSLLGLLGLLGFLAFIDWIAKEKL